MPDRDVRFELSAVDKTKSATESAAHGFERVSDKADKAKRSVDGLGDEASQLARKLAEARVAALGLARQFDKTGDSKILKDFEKVNREAAKLGRVAKSLKFDPPEVRNPDGFLGSVVRMARKAGLIAGDVAVDSFGEAFKGLGTASAGGNYIIAGLVGAAALAAPIIVGAVEAAVLAGIASGGLVAGIVLAAKDPRVAQAYTSLGSRLFTKLKDDADPFVAVLVAGARRFGAAFDAEEPRIKRIFTALAPVLDAVIGNTINAVHKIMPALERAAVAGGRVLVALGPQITALMGNIGDLLNAFSASGPGAAAALNLIIGELRVLIELMALGARGSAPLLNMLGKLMEMAKIVPDTTGNVHHLQEIQKTAGAGAAVTAGQYNNLAFSLRNTADMAKQLQDNFNRLFGEQMSVDQANLAVNTGLTQLKETIKGNKRTLDEHTAAGQQNVSVILSQIQALDQKRQADIAAGNGTAAATAQANAAYGAQLESLRKLLYSLGLNHAEVDKLINAYAELAKPQTKTFTTVYRTEGTPPGYSDQKTGHSRTGGSDYAGLSGWAPAAFNASRGGGFTGAGDGTAGGYSPVVELKAQHNFTVLLDGQPFHAATIRTVDQANQRAAWRAKVGKR